MTRTGPPSRLPSMPRPSSSSAVWAMSGTPIRPSPPCCDQHGPGPRRGSCRSARDTVEPLRCWTGGSPCRGGHHRRHGRGDRRHPRLRPVPAALCRLQPQRSQPPGFAWRHAGLQRGTPALRPRCGRAGTRGRDRDRSARPGHLDPLAASGLSPTEKLSGPQMRAGGRAVDCSGLENRRTCKRSGGSNPSLPASRHGAQPTLVLTKSATLAKYTS